MSDDVSAMYEDLCRELNMDKETEEKSWKKYVEVSQRSRLDGDPAHWLCCALYAECRLSYTPTVGGSNAVVMGNGISLNKLLRACKMSIYDFINKVKFWHEMTNISKDFLKQIEKLERTFNITITLFHHYNKIYEKLYCSSGNEKRNTKFRSVTKCSSNKLYDFGWCLYLCAKNEIPSYTVDLVSSFHLLICCIDLIYVNVLAENRVELINADFEGVPDKWNTPEFDQSSLSSYCIIEPLCKITEALFDDAKAMKDSCKKIIKHFFKTNTLNGNEETSLGIISNANFERNYKSLNCTYEQFVLSVGEFDERILLTNPNYRKLSTADTGQSGKADHHTKSLMPCTPITRKHSLPRKDDASEPAARATENVKQLQEVADIRELSEFIRQAGNETTEQILKQLAAMSDTFLSHFHNKDAKEEAAKRFQLAESLYFYLLDKILRVEVTSKPKIDLKVLLNNDNFTTTLLACCVEIVLAAHNSHFKFPWVLTCFSIDAFNFNKIIEIIVRRHDSKLTQYLVKHLDGIEQTCLESLIWEKASPLWIENKKIEGHIPTWSEVGVNNRMKRSELQLQSPMNTASDTFSAAGVGDSARRDLFKTAREATPSETVRENAIRQCESDKPSRSLYIFYRKFYKLAWKRMKKLCTDLHIDDELTLQRIWTLFEYSITQRTELMQDRHLDQILMCAIYIYIRVRDLRDKTFSEIMLSYRNQPQAKSSIYREVLMKPATRVVENGVDKDIPAELGDVILFYNNIYVTMMTPYALQFSEQERSPHDLLLSPHPTENQSYPRKLAANHLVYIQPMEKNEVELSPNHLIIKISADSPKKFELMKRKLPFEEQFIVQSKISKDATYLHDKLKDIIKDREQY